MDNINLVIALSLVSPDVVRMPLVAEIVPVATGHEAIPAANSRV